MSRRLTKRFSVEEVLVQVFGHDEEGTEIEPEIEEDVSEVEDNTDFDPDFEETDQLTDGEGEAPEEQAPEETFQSKSGHLLWSSSPQDRGSRARVENIIKMTPGPTRYATSRVDDIKSSFQLFLPESIEGIILDLFRSVWLGVCKPQPQPQPLPWLLSPNKDMGRKGSTVSSVPLETTKQA